MDKKLLTPGPLTTSMSTKEAMLHDWGSRDTKFIDLNASIRDSLVKLIDGEDKYLFESTCALIGKITSSPKYFFKKSAPKFS